MTSKELPPVTLADMQTCRRQWGDAYLGEVFGLIASAHYARQILPTQKREDGTRPGARLTPELVRLIRQRAQTENIGRIANQYGLGVGTILAVVQGRSWKHVT